MLGSRILIIDNYDSYTYNLYQLIASVCGTEPKVVRNDELPCTDHVALTLTDSFDAVVISPGPGSPDHASDIGICANILKVCPRPIFGVCLGMQAMAYCHGAEIERIQHPIHGLISPVTHNGDPLFRDIPNGFKVVRYHSLCVNPDTLASCLLPIAHVEGDPRMLMGLRHRDKPMWSVQFHPESVASEYGAYLFRNFLDMSCSTSTSLAPSPAPLQVTPALVETPPSPWVCYIQSLLDIYADPGAAFREFFADQEVSIWLDSEMDRRGRFSIMGDWNGDLAYLMQYDAATDKLAFSRKPLAPAPEGLPLHGIDILEPTSATAPTNKLMHHIDVKTAYKDIQTVVLNDCQVPFDFRGGLVGYLGYELRKVTTEFQTKKPVPLLPKPNDHLPDASLLFLDRAMVWDHHQKVMYLLELRPVGQSSSSWMSDMAIALKRLTLGSRSVLKPDSPKQVQSNGHHPYHGDCTLEHAHGNGNGATFPSNRNILADIHTNGNCQSKGAIHLLDKGGLKPTYPIQNPADPIQNPTDPIQIPALWDPAIQKPAAPIHFTFDMDKTQYMSAFQSIKELINEGETYEICLTNEIRAEVSADPMDVYLALRQTNAAPYAAYLRVPQGVVCSSSPERFLNVDTDGNVETKPIKGTVKRAKDPKEDAKLVVELKESLKDQCENLMITDVLRNDLGRVVETGSVNVPYLMAIESYATVHQMVSTIHGKLGPSKTIADLLLTCFPSGSISGAPKIRSMEIIDCLEKRRRGVYTGSIGYMSVNGEANLNISIRTAVVTPNKVSIGAGGAITTLSELEGEFEEMALKARPILRGVALAATGDPYAYTITNAPTMVDEKECAPLSNLLDPKSTRDRPGRPLVFDLLETMLFEFKTGEIFLLEGHLKRLQGCALHFNRYCDIGAIRSYLKETLASHKLVADAMIRLTVGMDGKPCLEVKPLPAPSDKMRTVIVDHDHVDSHDEFLRFKTTHRVVYGPATKLKLSKGVWDIILCNENGDVTEGTIANIAIKRTLQDGRQVWVTPPVECGLLRGVMRESLIAKGELEVGIVSRNELLEAFQKDGHVKCFNSVRKEYPVCLATYPWLQIQSQPECRCPSVLP